MCEGNTKNGGTLEGIELRETHASRAWKMYGTAAGSYPIWRTAALQYTLGVGTELDERRIFDILVVTCIGDCTCTVAK